MTDTDRDALTLATTRAACDYCGFPSDELTPVNGQRWCRLCVSRIPQTGRSTRRAEGNKAAKSDTGFEDWPGPTEDPTS